MLDPSSRQGLVSAFILSRIDFCNAAYAGLPARTLEPLQRLLNAAASRRSHGAFSRHRHHADVTLAAGRLSDSLQALTDDVSRPQRH